MVLVRFSLPDALSERRNLDQVGPVYLILDGNGLFHSNGRIRVAGCLARPLARLGSGMLRYPRISSEELVLNVLRHEMNAFVIGYRFDLMVDQFRNDHGFPRFQDSLLTTHVE